MDRETMMNPVIFTPYVYTIYVADVISFIWVLTYAHTHTRTHIILGCIQADSYQILYSVKRIKNNVSPFQSTWISFFTISVSNFFSSLRDAFSILFIDDFIISRFLKKYSNITWEISEGAPVMFYSFSN